MEGGGPRPSAEDARWTAAGTAGAVEEVSHAEQADGCASLHTLAPEGGHKDLGFDGMPAAGLGVVQEPPEQVVPEEQPAVVPQAARQPEVAAAVAAGEERGLPRHMTRDYALLPQGQSSAGFSMADALEGARPGHGVAGRQAAEEVLALRLQPPETDLSVDGGWAFA